MMMRPIASSSTISILNSKGICSSYRCMSTSAVRPTRTMASKVTNDGKRYPDPVPDRGPGAQELELFDMKRKMLYYLRLAVNDKEMLAGHAEKYVRPEADCILQTSYRTKISSIDAQKKWQRPPPIPPSGQWPPLHFLNDEMRGPRDPEKFKYKMEVNVKALPLKSEAARHKFRVLAGVRLGLDDFYKHSESRFESLEENELFIINTLKRMLEESNDLEKETYADIPVDRRQAISRLVKRKSEKVRQMVGKPTGFPQEWLWKPSRVVSSHSQTMKLAAKPANRPNTPDELHKSMMKDAAPTETPPQDKAASKA